MAIKQQKLLIKVPENFSQSQREAVGTEVINLIKERTQAGLDADNKPFKRYAKSYIDDPDFKLAGKSKSDVNLTFTGEMLNEISVLNQATGFVVIGFESGEVNEKASFAKDKGREFLGLTEKDKAKIIQNIASAGGSKIEEIIEVPSLTKRILDRLRGD